MMMASGKPVEDRSPNGNQIMDDGQSVQVQTLDSVGLPSVSSCQSVRT